MDDSDIFKNELEKLLASAGARKPKASTSVASVVTAWLLLTLLAFGISFVAGIAIGFATIGYRLITHLL